MNRHIITTRLTVLLAAGALTLTGCTATTTSPTDTPAATSAASAGAAIAITDAWVKATDSGMTAAFGTLKNTSGHDVTVVSAATPVSSSVQLHETVADASGTMVMQEKKGGFVIPAGGTLALQPGGNHIMLMGLAAPLKAGDELPFTLTFADGSTDEFRASIKDYSGANENYGTGSSPMTSPSPGN